MQWKREVKKKRKRKRRGKKINLLLFWTDKKYNQLDFVCPANPEIEKNMERKFPFCHQVYHESTRARPSHDSHFAGCIFGGEREDQPRKKSPAL